jgi:hypothetical protein
VSYLASPAQIMPSVTGGMAPVTDGMPPKTGDQTISD